MKSSANPDVTEKLKTPTASSSARCSASEEISKHDKRVLRNRMILGGVAMVCALDCKHIVPEIIVALSGFCLLLMAILDRWLGDGRTCSNCKHITTDNQETHCAHCGIIFFEAFREQTRKTYKGLFHKSPPNEKFRNGDAKDADCK